MMLHKNAFEPKDARIINLYENDNDDDLDDLSLFGSESKKNRKLMTGTQALAEFLNTTSPEEFQRHPPEKSTLSFLKRIPRRVTNSPRSSPLQTTLSSSSTLLESTSTIHRRNYIEIVPKLEVQTSTSSPPAGASLVTSPSSQQIPMLPSKNRDSSLYSGSLRHSMSIRSQMSTRIRPLGRHDTTTTLSTQASGGNRRSATGSSAPVIHTYNGTDTASIMEDFNSGDRDKLGDTEKQAYALVVAHVADKDPIEAGLLSRLQRYRFAQAEIPSNIVAAKLADEHLRALKASCVNPPTIVSAHPARRKARHIQVQTMPLVESTPSVNEPGKNKQCKKCQQPVSSDHASIQSLQRQLEEERLRRQRLQAALEETFDHFETLSGMAYKRLRELWEEKLRWENACMELRNGNDQSEVVDFPESEYIEEEGEASLAPEGTACQTEEIAVN
ncbi:uncharacterized protein BYT42DRAFT_564012 [Radiomyces spectabilis]|uniref:uncharacterized protein n=1 Tax=Radiomyces spectabilis TaxID=64574 RepID=UPI00221F9B95|nr:uncharacterized protein BYT42DRAFT_564012 [Radiomyces spectabilis]KAI8384906.1 hypothetical protein BYT42DRAFT_564012 [Radiomyces spectabilis]